jgi:hypothetical protein
VHMRLLEEGEKAYQVTLDQCALKGPHGTLPYTISLSRFECQATQELLFM